MDEDLDDEKSAKFPLVFRDLGSMAPLGVALECHRSFEYPVFPSRQIPFLLHRAIGRALV